VARGHEERCAGGKVQCPRELHPRRCLQGEMAGGRDLIHAEARRRPHRQGARGADRPTHQRALGRPGRVDPRERICRRREGGPPRREDGRGNSPQQNGQGENRHRHGPTRLGARQAGLQPQRREHRRARRDRRL